MQIKIEPVKIEEVELLASVSRQTFDHTFSAQNTKEDMELFLETAFSSDVLKAEMAVDNHFFFFAKIAGEVAGYLKLSTRGIAGLGVGNVLEISRIYVVPERIGGGVGKALMEFAISFAGENKKQKIFLGVWEKNERAIQFYQRFGFQKFGQYIFMLGNDAQTDWLMKKELEG